MPNLEDYKFQFRKEEEMLLEERKKLFAQKKLYERIYTTDARRKVAQIEKRIGECEKRVIEIRQILGENIRNN
jgi:Mg2+ and Co2+ transporter CorA